MGTRRSRATLCRGRCGPGPRPCMRRGPISAPEDCMRLGADRRSRRRGGGDLRPGERWVLKRGHSRRPRTVAPPPRSCCGRSTTRPPGSCRPTTPGGRSRRTCTPTWSATATRGPWKLVVAGRSRGRAHRLGARVARACPPGRGGRSRLLHPVPTRRRRDGPRLRGPARRRARLTAFAAAYGTGGTPGCRPGDRPAAADRRPCPRPGRARLRAVGVLGAVGRARRPAGAQPLDPRAPPPRRVKAPNRWGLSVVLRRIHP